MAVVKEVPERKVINPTNQRVDWLNARLLVADKGGLPPNVLHDEILIKLWTKLPEPEKAKLRAYYAAWAREVYAKPEKDGRFQTGQDLFDRQDRTVVPWSEIVRLGMAGAIIGPNIALFIDPGIKPEGVQIKKYKGIDNVAVVHPESIAIITPDIRISGNGGQVDERFGVPIDVDPEILEKLTFEQIRFIFMNADILSVRPLVRIGYFGIGNRQVVRAYCRRGGAFGVAGVDLEELQQQSEPPKGADDDLGRIARNLEYSLSRVSDIADLVIHRGTKPDQ